MFNFLHAVPWRSLRIKLVLGLFGITLPLIALLVYNNRYSVNVIHNQVAATNKNLMSIYMKQTDAQLTEAERYLVGLTMTDLNAQTMGEPVSEDAYMLAKSAVSRTLASDLGIYPYLDGFYVYSAIRGDGVDTYKGAMTYADLAAMREALNDTIGQLSEQPLYRNAKWKMQTIRGQTYLIRIIRDNNLYVGAWVKADTLLKPLQGMTGDTGAVLLVGEQGQALHGTRDLSEERLDLNRGFGDYYLSGRNRDYLIVGEASVRGGFSLVAAIQERAMLENLPNLTRASAIVIALAFLMLPLSFLFLRQALLLPMRRMVGAMRLIGEGNFNLRMETSPRAPDELALVSRTFNTMISRIEELKIHVYEEQLSKQRAELKHLQLQINPHFFMNSLNILYNLAQVKQFGAIQEMTMNLVHYFRYMFQSGRTLVPLGDELRHIRHYLRIQQMRFTEDALQVEIQVPPYLESTLIPPLMLQTVVENTIKYAVRPGEATVLAIEAELDDLAEEPMACITVRDNGEGFSDAALLDIREGRMPTDERGEHIGLWNIRERLKLQYGDQAWLDCYNDDPHGAVTEIAIPLNANMEPKE
ncbi:sensor histidine kinase [Paenibacillus methanolicus]|uniref:Two-component system sensor histidine kinase YesM n=1 Tax=Paenibacillus methanolicus TaxID=582686 RepID=A0A5S5C5Z2_9BACL|nr:sensor histidine kinase [Paenibacillus methanolicus]TYP74589.1 two-component system sensor histidine kinase YesM [Paenibacillus methanolicus]